MRFPRRALLWTSVAFLAMALACTVEPTAPEPIASLSIAPEVLTLASGGSTTLNVTVLSSSGVALEGRELTWATSDPRVATVSAAGVVTAGAVRTGTAAVATITVRGEGKMATATITVTPVPVARVLLNPDSSSITVGGRLQLAVVAQDASGETLTGRAILFTSLDAQVATVASTGEVSTPLYVGPEVRETRLTATVEGRSDTTRLVVTPLPVSRLLVSPDTLLLPAGTSRELSVVAQDASGRTLTGRTISWTSTDTSVVAVSAVGAVSARAYLGPETRAATILASVGSVVDTTIVRVSPVPVGRVIVSPVTGTLVVGGTLTLTAGITDSVGVALPGRLVTWTTSDAATAVVTATGLVTGLAPGTVTITAAAGGRQGVATLQVERPVASVEITPATGALIVGTAASLTAVVRAADGSVLGGRPVAWSSSDGSLATVSSDGVVTPLAEGTVRITAQSGDQQGTATFTILPAIASISIDPGQIDVLPGASVPLTATVRDARGNLLTDRALSWSVSNLQLLSVSSAGVVVVGLFLDGVTRVGSVIASSGAVADTVILTVRPLPVRRVDVTSGSLTPRAGTELSMTATPKDSTGRTLVGRAISWVTSDPIGAPIAPDGRIRTPYYVSGETRTVRVTATVDQSANGSVDLQVQPIPVASIDVRGHPADGVMLVGASRQLTVELRASDDAVLTGRTIAWSSTSPGVVGVTASTGILSALAVGSTDVRVQSDGVTSVVPLVVRIVPTAAITITFDDSWRDVVLRALPEMKALGLRGNVAWITTPLDDARLNLAELRTLRAEGWTIVSHSVSHPNLDVLASSIGVDTVRRQIVDSRAKVLENGFDGRLFVVPFARADAPVLAEIAAAGYSYARTRIQAGWSPDTLLSWPITQASARLRLAGIDATDYGPDFPNAYSFRTAQGRANLKVALDAAVSAGKYVDVFFHRLREEEVADFRLTLQMIKQHYAPYLITFGTLP